MPRRKDRLPVVLDTNVIVSHYIGKKPLSASAQIFRLWRYERKLQLIVSDEVTDEYFEILSRVGVAEQRIARLRQQLQEGSIVTHVNLGARHVISRISHCITILISAAQKKFWAGLGTSSRVILNGPPALPTSSTITSAPNAHCSNPN